MYLSSLLSFTNEYRMSCWTWLRSSLYYLCGGSFCELIYIEIAMFVSVMKVDVYYVPRSYLLVLIKHVYGSVWGVMCALVGVMGGGECGKLTTEISRSTWVFTLLCCLTRDKPKYHVARVEGDKPLPMTRFSMFLFSLHVLKLKAILWVILITKVLWFSSHLDGV